MIIEKENRKEYEFNQISEYVYACDETQEVYFNQPDELIKVDSLLDWIELFKKECEDMYNQHPICSHAIEKEIFNIMTGRSILPTTGSEVTSVP